MYTLELSFRIPYSQVEQVTGIGNSIERGLGYMRTLLPSEPGFVTARGLYSIDQANATLIIFQSVWERWEDVVNHRNSIFDEERLIGEFEPALDVRDINIRYYSEVP